MPKFEAHYRVSVQKENDPCADTGVADVTFPAPSRLPMADVLVMRIAVQMANKLAVGADGRAEFNGYCVYVSHVPSYGESELIGTVTRQYSWDQSADCTSASAHLGRIPYAEIDALNHVVAA